MKIMKRLILPAMLLLLVSSSIAQTAEAPPNVAAALTVKLVGFAENLSSEGSEVSIYVLGSPDVAAELLKGVGKPVGKAILQTVMSGDGLPETAPTVLFLGDASKLTETTAYTKTNKILSITNQPDLVTEGVTLGVGVGSDNKPKILLNLTSTTEEGISWNPAIMKVARTIK